MEKKEKRYRNPAQRYGLLRNLMTKTVKERQNNLKQTSKVFIVNRLITKRNKRRELR